MKSLNEQTSRIKQMMGLNEGEIYKSGSEDDEEQRDMPGFEGTQDNLDALTIREQQTNAKTLRMEKGKDYYGISTKDGQKYLIKVLETTGLMGDCNVFFGETLIAKGYTMFVGGNFNAPIGVWSFKDPQFKSKYGDFKVTSTSNL